MNSHFCFMIRFIMENYSGIEQELSNVLYKNISNYWKDITITLISSEDYWKYPEERDIIYKITISPCIAIKNLISYFPVSWVYKEIDAYSVDLKINYIYESAIWNKNCHLEEIFLLPKVSWVHIYTSPY